jgi:hypothetical protein
MNNNNNIKEDQIEEEFYNKPFDFTENVHLVDELYDIFLRYSREQYIPFLDKIDYVECLTFFFPEYYEHQRVSIVDQFCLELIDQD